MTLHMNQNYYWHRARYIPHPPFSMHAIHRNLQFLREHFYRTMGVESPSARVGKEGYIVLVNRRDRGRKLINADKVLADIRRAMHPRYNVYPRVVYFEEMPLPQLVRLLSRTHVLMAPHGAGLANLIYMRAGSAVVELIPFMCHRLRIMYAPLADAMHVHYSFWQPNADQVDGLSETVKSKMLKEATMKREPCPHSHSRTDFYGDSKQLFSEVVSALDHVHFGLDSRPFNVSEVVKMSDQEMESFVRVMDKKGGEKGIPDSVWGELMGSETAEMEDADDVKEVVGGEGGEGGIGIRSENGAGVGVSENGKSGGVMGVDEQREIEEALKAGVKFEGAEIELLQRLGRGGVRGSVNGETENGYGAAGVSRSGVMSGSVGEEVDKALPMEPQGGFRVSQKKSRELRIIEANEAKRRRARRKAKMARRAVRG